MPVEEILRRLDLPLQATDVASSSTSEDVQKLSNSNTTFHVTCGKCGKVILQPPYDRCLHCLPRLSAATIVICAICRKAGNKSHYVYCFTCGHAVHTSCLHSLPKDPMAGHDRLECASGCGHAAACPLAIAV